MRRLDIDFAPPSNRNTWIWAVVGLAAGATLLAVLSSIVPIQGAVRALAIESAQLAAAVEAIALKRQEATAQAQRQPAYAADALAVLPMATMDIGAVLTALESVKIPGVRLLGLEISAPDQTARVELELAEPTALLRYLEAINAGEQRPRWQLLRTETPISGSASTATLLSRWPNAER